MRRYMDTKCDLRILRTHSSLNQAFFQLMNEKCFEDITVNELCERAMIRRTTFYYHFDDKYDYFQFFMQQLHTDLSTKNIDSVKCLSLSAFCSNNARLTLRFVSEHEQFIKMILTSSLLPDLLEIVSKQAVSDLTELIRIGSIKDADDSVSPEIMVSFFTGAYMNIIKWWLAQKKQISEERLLQEIGKIFLAWGGLSM